MEICQTVSECKPRDWVVGYDANDDGVLEDSEKQRLRQKDMKPINLVQVPLLNLPYKKQIDAMLVAFKRRDSGALEPATWPNDR